MMAILYWPYLQIPLLCLCIIVCIRCLSVSQTISVVFWAYWIDNIVDQTFLQSWSTTTLLSDWSFFTIILRVFMTRRIWSCRLCRYFGNNLVVQPSRAAWRTKDISRSIDYFDIYSSHFCSISYRHFVDLLYSLWLFSCLHFKIPCKPLNGSRKRTHRVLHIV